MIKTTWLRNSGSVGTPSEGERDSPGINTDGGTWRGNTCACACALFCVSVCVNPLEHRESLQDDGQHPSRHGERPAGCASVLLLFNCLHPAFPLLKPPTSKIFCWKLLCKTSVTFCENDMCKVHRYSSRVSPFQSFDLYKLRLPENTRVVEPDWI